MAKVRLTVITTYEYEILPEEHASYIGCETDQERLQLDLQTYNQEPELLELLDSTSVVVKGQIVKGEVEHG